MDRQAALLLALLSVAGCESGPDGYTGDLQNGVPQGRGRLVLSNGETQSGTWSRGKLDGPATVTYADGGRYEGMYREGRRNGQGTYTWPNGNRHAGNWENDAANGSGVFTTAAGERREGAFRQGRLNGRGVYTNTVGMRWEGTFADNKLSGSGTYTDNTGNRFVGNFVDGMPQGSGTLTNEDGRVHVGEWLGGCMQGTSIGVGRTPDQCAAHAASQTASGGPDSGAGGLKQPVAGSGGQATMAASAQAAGTTARFGASGRRGDVGMDQFPPNPATPDRAAGGAAASRAVSPVVAAPVMAPPPVTATEPVTRLQQRLASITPPGCTASPSYLLPLFSNLQEPTLQMFRREAVRQTFTDMMAKAKASGLTKDGAIQAALAQAAEHERTARDAIMTVRQTSSGYDSDRNLRALVDGRNDVETPDWSGTAGQAFMVAVMNMWAATAARATASQFGACWQ